MRRPLFWIVAVAAILAALFFFARPSCAQLTSTFQYQFGLRPATSDTLRPALEFSLRYELLRETDDPRGHHFNYALWTSGWQTFNAAIRDVDHMEAGLAIGGRHYHNELNPLAPEVQDHYVSLLERSEAGGGPGISASEEAELIALMDKVRKNRQFFGYGGTVAVETDGKLENKRVNVGFGVQAELPFLSQPLDALFARTRGTGDPFVAQPVRASLAVEYIKGLAGRDDDYPRGWAEILWNSRIMDRVYPRLKWQAEYATEQPDGVADFNHFLDAGVALPITSQTSVVAKYIYGRTAPNYELVNAFVLGFDVTSW